REGPGAQRGRAEEPAEQVVGSEDAVVPPRGRGPRKRGARHGVGAETGRPGREIGRATAPPAACDGSGQAQRDERRGEGEQLVRRRSLLGRLITTSNREAALEKHLLQRETRAVIRSRYRGSRTAARLREEIDEQVDQACHLPCG